MAEEKKIKKKIKAPQKKVPIKKVEPTCKDKLCPRHADKKLKLRGRIFDGRVIRKLHGRVTIGFDRMIKVPKYERYEKRKTRIHARLTECMQEKVNIGDLVRVSETRKISKMINFVVSDIIKLGIEK